MLGILAFVLLAVAVIVVVHLVADKTGLPAAALLTLAGLAGAALPIPGIELDSEVILTFVIPPLRYSAALNSSLLAIGKNLRSVFSLSVALTVATAVLVGLGIDLLIPGVTLAAGIAFGAAIAPPDPVAALAVGRRAGLHPKIGPYPRLVDTGGGLGGGCRRSGVEGLVGVRGPVSAPGVPPSGVVAGDPAEHLAPACGLVGPGVRVLEDFSFEGGVEGFGQAVVGARADFAHRLGHSETGAECGEVLRRVLRAVIRVKDRPGQSITPLGGGTEGVGDEVGAHMVGDCPAGEFTGVAVRSPSPSTGWLRPRSAGM